nr:hypothetical protein [Candidatus Sigynarchaeota archaeon]
MTIRIAGRGPIVTHNLDKDQKIEANVKEALACTHTNVPELWSLTYNGQNVVPTALASEFEGQELTYSITARAASNRE